MTEFDKIKNMNEKQLANYISEVFLSGYIFCLKEKDKVNKSFEYSKKFNEYLKFLAQEAQ